MNSQNIQDLVEFIRKNPGFSSSQLEESVLKAGYSREEFSQALEIVGKNQTVGSFGQNEPSINQEALAPEQNKKPNRILPFTILGILVLLVLTGIAGFYFLKQNKVKSTGELQNSQPPAAVSENNPMKTFFTALSSADYKIITSGKIENKKQEGSGTQTSSLDLNNGTVYVQKGSVVRIDKTDPQEPEIAFMRDGKIYVLNPEKKMYAILNLSDSFGQFYLSAFNATFPLIPLSDDTQKGIVSWQKGGNNEWQADWKWQTPLDPKETPVKVRVILEATTNLITTLSMKFDDSQPWQDATFKYERIENIESLLTIPSDYKEEKLEF